MSTTLPTPRSLRALLSSLSLVGLVATGCSLAEANPRPHPETPSAHVPANAPAQRTVDGCEVEERAGQCMLEDVSAVTGATGEREVVAVYRVTEGGVPVRVERRYRVSYLAAGEGPHMNFLRANPHGSCRWQAVLRGVCPAHPATVEIPESNVREPRHRRARARLPGRARRRAT
jgi:hypothetical protein